jgi:hypothetical protein
MQILSEAEDRVGLIFRKAGVEVKWADCPLNDEDPALYPGCPEVFDDTQLFLRIFPMTATKMDHGGESVVAARIAKCNPIQLPAIPSGIQDEQSAFTIDSHLIVLCVIGN